MKKLLRRLLFSFFCLPFFYLQANGPDIVKNNPYSFENETLKKINDDLKKQIELLKETNIMHKEHKEALKNVQQKMVEERDHLTKDVEVLKEINIIHEKQKEILIKERDDFANQVELLEKSNNKKIIMTLLLTNALTIGSIIIKLLFFNNGKS